MITLLIDLNQLSIASISGIQQNSKAKQEFNQDFVRKIIINAIANLRSQFIAADKLETVVCCDSRSNWRKTIFPYYKAKRKYDIMSFPWEEFMQYYAIVKSELVTYFPYKTIEIADCEGDDVIATVVNHIREHTKCVIASADGDFKQLHGKNVVQWDLRNRKFIKCESPKAELIRKIIKGDSGDNVPNVLSDDASYVTPGVRQTPMRIERLTNIYQHIVDDKINELPDHVQRNIARNKRLIELSEETIPENLRTEILDKYNNYILPSGMVFKYLIDNKIVVKDTRGLT